MMFFFLLKDLIALVLIVLPHDTCKELNGRSQTYTSSCLMFPEVNYSERCRLNVSKYNKSRKIVFLMIQVRLRCFLDHNPIIEERYRPLNINKVSDRTVSKAGWPVG